MTITTKDAAGLAPAAFPHMPKNEIKSMMITARPAGGGTPQRFELVEGTRIKSVRGFGLKGQSVEIGTVFTIGKDVDFETAFFLINASKAVILPASTPFDRESDHKAKK